MFCKLFLKVTNVNFNIIKKYFKKKKESKILTILKSPHVNKKAQDQFEIKYFKKQLTIHSFHNIKFLYFFKNIKNNLFFNIKTKLKFNIAKNKTKKLKIQIINPINFKIKTYKNLKRPKYINGKFKTSSESYLNKIQHITDQKKINNLLKIFDSYGEILKHI
jgi:hypothetical protein